VEALFEKSTGKEMARISSISLQWVGIQKVVSRRDAGIVILLSSRFNAFKPWMFQCLTSCKPL